MTQLKPAIEQQIGQEAQDITTTLKDNNDYRAGYKQGFEDGYEKGATTYAQKWQQAEEMMERMTHDLNLINKWCKETGLNAVAIDNPVHMAVYQSLHQSNKSLTDYNTYKSQSNDTTR